MTTLALLLLLAGFQVKHVLGDYVFQNAYILENRRIWGHPGGLLHVAIHAALTLPLLLAAGVHGLLFFAILLGEAVFHYHVDWVKDGWIHRAGLGPPPTSNTGGSPASTRCSTSSPISSSSG